jgi:hypothetical protein
MIFEYKDFLDDLKMMHPNVTEKSLISIVKSGLFGINSVIRKGDELILRGFNEAGSNDFIKFIIKMDQKDHDSYIARKINKKKKQS